MDLHLTRPQSLALDDGNGFDVCCQRLTRERAYSPVLKYNEGLWKSQDLHASCNKVVVKLVSGYVRIIRFQLL